MANEKDSESIVTRITEIAERVGMPEGLEIVDVELLGAGAARVLRIVIDKPDGVTHADCELISHGVGSTLDEEDTIPGEAYRLEVSSPGIERKLKKVADFEKFRGRRAKVVLTQPVDDQKHWEGTIHQVEGNLITLQPSEGRFVAIPLEFVRKANLKHDW